MLTNILNKMLRVMRHIILYGTGERLVYLMRKHVNNSFNNPQRAVFVMYRSCCRRLFRVGRQGPKMSSRSKL